MLKLLRGIFFLMIFACLIGCTVEYPFAGQTAAESATALPQEPSKIPTAFTGEYTGQLVYIRDSMLYIHNLETGETIQYDDTTQYLQTPSAGSYLSISPNHRYIAFNGIDPLYGCPTYNTDQPCVLTGPDGYFIVDTTIGEVSLVAPFAISNISWAPEGENFVFAGIEYNKEPYQTALKVKTPGTGEPLYVTSSENVDAYPAWSPDGEWIAFLRSPSPLPDQPKCETDSSIYDTCSDPDLYIIHPDGSGLTRLAQHIRIFNSPYNAPAWSPDGKILVVVTGPDAEEISLVDITTGQIKILNGLIPILQTPAWSPDGQTLLLSSQVTGYREMIQTNLDGSEITNLSNRYSAECCPVWSPDGAAVAYISQHTSVRRTLLILSVETPGLEPVEFREINTRFMPLWVSNNAQ